jgi:DNA invertase Pin-like site-specific DNA recombinase
MTGEGTRAVGYIRVSTREQAQEGVSLAAQEERIRAFCTAKGWELLRIYRDEGVSGKSLDRPGVQAMIRDLKGDGVDVVVILKLDRLTRSVRDLGSLIEDLFGGVALAAVDGSLDSSTAGGRMVVNLLGSVAQWEREVIAERTKDALTFKREKGEWCGRVPFGFTVGEDGRLVEDPEEMRTILAMKRARRRGASFPKLARRFGVSVGTVYKVTKTDLRVLRREAKVAQPVD